MAFPPNASKLAAYRSTSNRTESAAARHRMTGRPAKDGAAAYADLLLGWRAAGP